MSGHTPWSELRHKLPPGDVEAIERVRGTHVLAEALRELMESGPLAIHVPTDIWTVTAEGLYDKIRDQGYLITKETP